MLAELAVNLLASAVLLAVGYLFGMYRERRLRQGKNLEDYEFYPFGVDDTGRIYFDEAKFVDAVEHLLRHRDDVAAHQLILVGEQNEVRFRLDAPDREHYAKFYRRYGGDEVRDENSRFLANFKRIVRLIGDSFPDTGIEIILHDLTNPSTALCVIKNNVTGRNIDAPATNLVLDLKTRRQRNQDKLNYELNIGSRRFKCTTIPIYRDPVGLVGAICINVDANFLTEEVLRKADVLEAFIASLTKTDMTLDENILSKLEYEKALGGKRHFRDFSAPGS